MSVQIIFLTFTPAWSLQSCERWDKEMALLFQAVSDLSFLTNTHCLLLRSFILCKLICLTHRSLFSHLSNALHHSLSSDSSAVLGWPRFLVLPYLIRSTPPSFLFTPGFATQSVHIARVLYPSTVGGLLSTSCPPQIRQINGATLL